MSGYVGNLSPSQEETLQRFRRAVEDFPNKPEDNDHYYLRWLRAKSFNLDTAVEMLANHLKWRQEVGADQIFDWTPPEVLQKYYPGGFFGEDKKGHPVYYDFYGNMDIIGFYRSCNVDEDVIKLKIFHGELIIRTLQEASKKKGRHIGDIVLVLDLENLSYQKHCYWPFIQLTRQLFQIYSDNYPEMLHTVFIINAPRIFPMAYNLVKNFVDEKTNNKVVILGDNWQEELQKYISPDQLPQAYGGTRCEPDPQCTAYINWGGDIPERYYLTNLTETKKEDMKTVVVGAGLSHNLVAKVDKEGSSIKWEYITIDYDIGFGIYYKPDISQCNEVNVNSMYPVVPNKRKNSHLIPETGLYRCTATGTYVVQFDNTYSWTRAKEVMYSIEVLPPEVMPDQSDLSHNGCTPCPQSNHDVPQET